IDSGAGGIFLNEQFIRKHNIPVTPLPKTIKVFNVDGTRNKEGLITHCTWLNLQIGEHKIPTRFLITGLGQDDMILGLPWLKQYNPDIDWIQGTMDIQTVQIPKRPLLTIQRNVEMAKAHTWQRNIKTTMEEELEEPDQTNDEENLEDGITLCRMYA